MITHVFTEDELKKFDLDIAHMMNEGPTQEEMLLATARAMIVMFKGTKGRHYLRRARECTDLIETRKAGFMRPLGVIIK
jgi:hypothetical protein